MKVRETHVSDSDKRSAQVFFDALLAFWDMREATTLDAFARNGQLTLACYQHKVSKADAWELGPEHRAALERFPLHDLRIGDSYAFAAEEPAYRYDMIVIDTPQGVHCDQSDLKLPRVEHFDFMEMALARLLKDRGVLVVYVNKAPYDRNEVGSHGYDDYEEYDFKHWMNCREMIYDIHDGRKLNEEDAVYGYRRLINRCGYRLVNMLMVPCFSDVPGKEPYAFRLALECVKEK